MQVQYYRKQTETVQEPIVYTEDYLSCWEDGVPVRQPGPAIGRRAVSTSNT